MTNFKFMSGEDIIEELSFTGPVAGESLTMPIRKMPYDRPPDTVDAQELLERIFYQLGKPKMISKILALLESNIPLDSIVASFLAHLSGEGKTSPYVAILMAPSITVMLSRMAEAAGIDYKLSEDRFEISEDDINRARMLMDKNRPSIDKAATRNEKDSKDLVKKSKNISLMQRPERLL